VSVTFCEAKSLRIIPVIDVLDCIVVHAIRGRRSEYKPIRSVLSSSVDPLEIASMFRAYGFDELYLADLDAIAGRQANCPLYSLTAKKTGLELMIDAGIADIERAEEILRIRASKVVIGTETLKDLGFVREAVERFGSKRVVISLDLFGNKVLGGFSTSNLEPLALLDDFVEDGVERVIILDLARVGSEEGVNFQLLKSASAISKLKLIAGGGIRDMKDLLELEKTGIDAVLLATALHSGKITVENLRLSGFLHQAS
jgi:phosphoribosylformimino-5-aminoimidazole carboxamide ribotide isomerase